MSQQPEIWKDIKGFEGFYQVSTLGRIKSLPRGKRNGKVLRPYVSDNGYLYVSLSKNGKHTNVLIHRIVAKTFISNPNLCDTVNHKNFNKQDNSVNNLEWMSKGDNTRHAHMNYHSKHRMVCQLTLDGEFVKFWPTIASATEQGFIGTLISKCCQGKVKQHKGFKWQYYEQSKV